MKIRRDKALMRCSKNQSINSSLGFETSHTTKSLPPWKKIPKSAIRGGNVHFTRRIGTKPKIVEPIKTFLDQFVQAGHLKEYIDQENTKAKEAKVRPNLRFDRGNDEEDDAL